MCDACRPRCCRPTCYSRYGLHSALLAHTSNARQGASPRKPQTDLASALLLQMGGVQAIQQMMKQMEGIK
jgi:hypothetical protein